MEKLIKEVLNKYNSGRKKLPNEDLARLIVAHIKVGINGKKGWFLNLNSYIPNTCIQTQMSQMKLQFKILSKSC